jgi:hypothetical protein
MPQQTRIVAPGPNQRTVRTRDGQVLEPPTDWILLPPGDAGLTRRVKASGPTWTVQEKKGRRMFSLGVWAARRQVETIRQELAAERATEAYAKKRAASTLRRERSHAEYVQEFRQATLDSLAFSPLYTELAARLAEAVAQHATPVGSGTVARTQRIPIQRRAKAAVIAWLRHRTTAYDQLKIPRVKGKRREVRRMLAEQSRQLLKKYRQGEPVDRLHCPLHQALVNLSQSGRPAP